VSSSAQIKGAARSQFKGLAERAQFNQNLG
jgi:hypothetical protein